MISFALATSASAWSSLQNEWPETRHWAMQQTAWNYASLPKLPVTLAVPRVPCPEDATAETYGKIGSCWWSCQTEKAKCLRETDISACKEGHYGLIFADRIPKYTAGILNLLQDRGLKATFCLSGARLVEDPQLAKRIVDEGHDLCMLTWSNWPMTSMNDTTIISDIMWSAKAFQDILGVLPELFLPPHGSLDDRVREIINGLGFRVLMWNFSVKDTRKASRKVTKKSDEFDRIYTNMAPIKAEFSTLYQKDYPNGILSLHDDNFEASIKYTKFVLDTVQPKYKVVPVSQCLDRSLWRDTQGELPVPELIHTHGAPISVTSGLLTVFGFAGTISMML